MTAGAGSGWFHAAWARWRRRTRRWWLVRRSFVTTLRIALGIAGVAAMFVVQAVWVVPIVILVTFLDGHVRAGFLELGAVAYVALLGAAWLGLEALSERLDADREELDRAHPDPGFGPPDL